MDLVKKNQLKEGIHIWVSFVQSVNMSSFMHFIWVNARKLQLANIKCCSSSHHLYGQHNAAVIALIIDFMALRATVAVVSSFWWHASSCVPWLQPESSVETSKGQQKGRHKRTRDMHRQHGNLATCSLQHATCNMHFNFITKVTSTNRAFTDTSKKERRRVACNEAQICIYIDWMIPRQQWQMDMDVDMDTWMLIDFECQTRTEQTRPVQSWMWIASRA